MNLEYIFCDMDGVLVDFDKGYKKLTNINITGQWRSDKEFWDPIHKAGKNFWSNLKWTKDGKYLWSYIARYNPVLLSTPSEKNSSRIGKRDWVNKNLPGIRLILSYDKHNFAGINRILIDDKKENIIDFISKGGIGILHTSTNNTIIELNKLGL